MRCRPDAASRGRLDRPAGSGAGELRRRPCATSTCSASRRHLPTPFRVRAGESCRRRGDCRAICPTPCVTTRGRGGTARPLRGRARWSAGGGARCGRQPPRARHGSRWRRMPATASRTSGWREAAHDLRNGERPGGGAGTQGEEVQLRVVLLGGAGGGRQLARRTGRAGAATLNLKPRSPAPVAPAWRAALHPGGATQASLRRKHPYRSSASERRNPTARSLLSNLARISSPFEYRTLNS